MLELQWNLPFTIPVFSDLKAFATEIPCMGNLWPGSRHRATTCQMWPATARFRMCSAIHLDYTTTVEYQVPCSSKAGASSTALGMAISLFRDEINQVEVKIDRCGYFQITRKCSSTVSSLQFREPDSPGTDPHCPFKTFWFLRKSFESCLHVRRFLYPKSWKPQYMYCRYLSWSFDLVLF